MITLKSLTSWKNCKKCLKEYSAKYIEHLIKLFSALKIVISVFLDKEIYKFPNFKFMMWT